MSFHDIIGPDSAQILWWQMCVRAIILFTFGFLMIRLFGVRAFGRQNALDIVLSIVIGSNISRAMTANAAFIPTIASTGVLVIGYWIMDQAAARSSILGRMLKGAPIVLGRGGELDERRMLRHAITRSDIEESARSSGIARLEDVQAVLFEKNGKITTLKKNP